MLASGPYLGLWTPPGTLLLPRAIGRCVLASRSPSPTPPSAKVWSSGTCLVVCALLGGNRTQTPTTQPLRDQTPTPPLGILVGMAISLAPIVPHFPAHRAPRGPGPLLASTRRVLALGELTTAVKVWAAWTHAFRTRGVGTGGTGSASGRVGPMVTGPKAAALAGLTSGL